MIPDFEQRKLRPAYHILGYAGEGADTTAIIWERAEIIVTHHMSHPRIALDRQGNKS